MELIDTDGRLYNKIADPPGQKCTYILPGDTEKESYRLSTFLKFPENSPIDPIKLASHGFLYTGYKDRVKCFSCGANVLDWSLLDDPNAAKWHFRGCELVLGTDRRNKPIINKPLQFTGDFAVSNPISISTVSSQSNHQQVQMGDNRANQLNFVNEEAPLPTDESLSQGLSVVHINNEINNLPTVMNQTARFREQPAALQETTTSSIPRMSSSTTHLSLLNLSKEEDRRKSFVGWTFASSTVTPTSLASNGFFYLGDGMRVKCFSCSGIISEWNPSESVENKHKLLFPQCKMVRRIETKNIAICSNLVEPPDPSSEEEESLQRLFPCLNPLNPNMRDVDAREQTFDSRWPSHKQLATPRHIARAGFYFMGENDRTKCWYCNGGLQRWESNEEPFTEHAKWFPGCEFILRSKGVEFVKSVVAMFPDLQRPILRSPRFDPVTGRVLPPEYRSSETNAIPSAGSVLHNFIPSSQSSNLAHGEGQNTVSSAVSNAWVEIATSMGFSQEVIKETADRRLQVRGSSYKNIQEFLDDLLAEPSSSGISSQEVTPTTALSAGASAFKRNSTKLDDNSRKGRKEEAPIKKSKQDVTLSELEQERNCRVCRINPAAGVVMPCGHLAVCHECSNNLKKCPICNKFVKDIIKAYLA